MSGSSEVKRRPEVLDNLAIQAAKMHYEGELTPAQIAGRLKTEGVRDARDARGLLQRAQDPKRRLITLKVHSTVAVPRDEELGTELQKISRSGTIRTALVAKTRLASSEDYNSPDPKKRQQWEADSNELHRQLGEVAGEYLRGHLRPDDCIAVGSGRGPWFTVEALRRRQQIPRPDLGRPKVISLAAGMLVGPSWESSPVVDADIIAVELAGVVGAEEVALVQLPIALDSRNEDVIRSVAPHLLDDSWEGQRPDIALFGLGVVNPMYYMVRHPSRAPAIQGDIKELRDKVLSEHPLAVADICHHYWVVPEVIASDDLRERAMKLIDSVNAKTLSVSLPKLDQAKEKILVAGGAPKYPALLSLLMRPDDIGLHITVLVTDEVTARRLVQDIPKQKERLESGLGDPRG